MSETPASFNQGKNSDIGVGDSYYFRKEDYDLQSSYSREVGQYSLLTGAEEGYWSQAFFVSRGRIQKLLLSYPSLLIEKALRVLNGEPGGVGSYVEFAEDCAELSDIREVILRWKNQLEHGLTFDFRSEVVYLGIVRIRDLFYEDCLEMIFSEQWTPAAGEDADWESDKAQLRKYWDRLRQSRNSLVNGNLRLVLSIARRYNRSNSMNFADLVQEGNIGLMRAIESFEYKRGHRFSTYATYWIRQAISKALCNHGRIIRMPVHIIRELSRIRRCERELLQATGETPTVEKIAEVLKIPVSRIRGLLKMSQQPISLENIGNDNQNWEELLTDENEESFRHQMDSPAQHLKEAVLQALDCLDLRERQIIERHFGLNGRDPETHEQISRSFHLSSERIRQIELGALRKLKLHGVF